MNILDLKEIIDTVVCIRDNSERLNACVERLQQVENCIREVVADPFGDPVWFSKCSDFVNFELLLETRCWILNQMFEIHCTKEEVDQFSFVNDRLFELTKKMYAKTSKVYRQQLNLSVDEEFDDDMFVEAVLHLAVEEEKDILVLPDDSFYTSDFAKMNSIITTFEQEENGLSDIEHILVEHRPEHTLEMTDCQLGIFDNLDDGISWQEGCLCIEALNGIKMCHATHDICTHKNYSIPDYLRLNCFWIDVKITVQHISNQNGERRMF